jgi:hypothetical protein
MTGKPGSGKSTLMKYLVHHPKTMSLLNQWAGEKDLTLAYYYFWNSGTEMQKSQEGLLRTIWYHIVEQSPAKALEHTPVRFASPSSLSARPWTEDELCTAIEGYTSACKQGETDSEVLCLFIDGLDEYTGDQHNLVKLVSRLATFPSIKLCVSSRPWNVFVRAYDRRADRQLRMQEFTASDIEAYIADTLTGNELFRELQAENFDCCQELILLIKDKSQGVFLWVYLVLESLLRGLDNDDNLDILWERVQEYPDDLDAYYRRMFDRIEKVYQQHSARIILWVLDGRFSIGLMQYYLELESALPEYAQMLTEVSYDARNVARKCFLRHCPVIGGKCLHFWGYCLSMDEYDAEVERRYRRYIDARCADFIECTGLRSDLSFIHRTAADFMERIRPTLQDNAGAWFDPGLSVAKTLVALLKSGGLTTSSEQQGCLEDLFEQIEQIKLSSVPEYLALLQYLVSHGEEYSVAYLDFSEGDGVSRVDIMMIDEDGVQRPALL